MYNPEAVPLGELRDVPCLVLLGEPGQGKTTALNAEFEASSTSQGAGSGVFLRKDLNAYQSDSTLRSEVFGDAEYRGWLESDRVLHLFLDSLDECLLRVEVVAKVLAQELGRAPVDRLRLRIACRTVDWPASLERSMSARWKAHEVRAYQLAPLTRGDVIAAAEAKGIDAPVFLGAVEALGAVPLVTKPVTLQFLMNIFKNDGRLSSSLRELYESGCRHLCEEPNESRLESPSARPRLDSKQRLAVAERLAALSVFSGRPSIWVHPDRGEATSEALTIDQVTGGAEAVDGDSVTVDQSAAREALDTGLFSGRGPGVLGFAHRTYAEFLAARYLHRREFAAPQVAGMIFHHDDQGRVVPQLREAAAWLAGMDQAVFRRIMDGDPQVLLRSGVEVVRPDDRRPLIDALLRLFDAGKIDDRDRALQSRYRLLDHPGLGGQLSPFIEDKVKNTTARGFAIEVAEACGVSSLQGLLAGVVFDEADEPRVRKAAARAAGAIGDGRTKSGLKPLAFGRAGPDPDDELRGIALRALWPGCLTADEVLQAVSKPQNSRNPGLYTHFLYQGLVEGFDDSDLPKALAWATGPAAGTLDDLQLWRVTESLIRRSVGRLDQPGVLENLAKLAASRYRGLTRLLRYERVDEPGGLFGSPENRRRLVLAMIPIIEARPGLLGNLFLGNAPLLTSADVPWMLERLEDTTGAIPRETWARLIRRGYDFSAEQKQAVVAAMHRFPALADAFRPVFDPAEPRWPESPSSPEPEPAAILDPPPEVRIKRRLESLESGNTDEWWPLTMTLMLEPTSTQYVDGFEEDLTALPGWRAADAGTRERIITAAERYIIEARDVDVTLAIRDQWDSPSLSGYKAFLLLDGQKPSALAALPASAWDKWAPFIAGYPFGRIESEADPGARILRRAYERSPGPVIETFLRRIDHENASRRWPGCLERMVVCWDERLANSLLDKARDPSLSGPFLERLLEELLRRGVPGAADLASSFVTAPLPAAGVGRARGLGAATALLLNAPDGGWAAIRPLLEKDLGSARELFLAVADRAGTAAFCENLSAGQVAELYRWMSDQFPYGIDSKIDGVDALAPRQRVGFLRDHVLRALEYKGSPEAVQELERLVDDLPALPWLNHVLINAREMTRRRIWRRPSPAEILKLAKDRDRRLVESDAQLMDVLVESLCRLEQELQGETPLSPALWNDLGKGVFRPKEENWLSDYVAQHLRRDLKDRGIILNREVEIRRRSSPSGEPGEETDIQVDAILPRSHGQLTVIVEVKGCWHKELQTAMESQLLGRYLRENRFRYGLYLVGWYVCPQWDKTHDALNRVPFDDLGAARSFFEDQAARLSTAEKSLRAYVLNAALH
jgi:hypothetical protein